MTLYATLRLISWFTCPQGVRKFYDWAHRYECLPDCTLDYKLRTMGARVHPGGDIRFVAYKVGEQVWADAYKEGQPQPTFDQIKRQPIVTYDLQDDGTLAHSFWRYDQA